SRYHVPCNKWDESRSNWNPTRLVDVGVSGKSSRVRLFQPESGLDPINYLTLSHRWGTQILFTLTTLNIREMTRQIPLQHLSKTFRDAIEITRRLGIRYLWIDSLCIIQDSPQDWRSESARMGDVYKFAYCNLSATQASGGSYDGLYVDRDPLTVKPLLLSAKACQATPALVKSQAYCIHRGFEEWTELTNAALNKRAWVLQERIMSPRTLHFCRNQVIFECCMAQCSERWPRRSALLLGYNDYYHYPLKAAWARLDAHSTPTTMKFWANIIKHYPTMDLSIGTDRLIALSGIARSVQSHLGNQEYVAGFWSDDLLSQLLWRCKVPAKVEDGDRNGGFMAPS
ncbi:HET-domain-containing protein, partial [Hyaloscypha bicolor E]